MINMIEYIHVLTCIGLVVSHNFARYEREHNAEHQEEVNRKSSLFFRQHSPLPIKAGFKKII